MSMTAEIGIDVGEAQQAIEQFTSLITEFADHLRELGKNLGHHMFDDVERRAETMGHALKHHASAARGELDSLAESAGKVSSALNHEGGESWGMGYKSIAIGAGLAATAAAAAAVVINKSFAQGSKDQTMRVKLEAQVGDTSKTQALIAGLQGFSLKNSMFKTEDLAKDATRLVNMGKSAEEIPGILKRVGDVAVGTANDIGEIAKQFVEISGKSQVFTKDLDALQSKGIPVTEALAKAMHKSKEEVEALARQGALTGANITSAFDQMTSAGGRFHGMMARESRTTAGLMETIKKETAAIWSELGQPINDVFAVKLQADVEWVKTLHGWARKAGEALADTARVGIATWEALDFSQMFAGLRAGTLIAFKDGINFLWNGINGTGAALRVEFSSASQVLIATFQYISRPEIWNGMRTAFSAAADRLKAAGYDMAATIHEVIAKIPGNSVGDTASKERAAARDLIARASQKEQQNTPFAPLGEQIAKIMRDGAVAAANAFHEQASKAGVFDTSKEIDELSKLGTKIAAKISEVEAAKLKSLPQILKPEAGDASAPKSRAGLGGFASAVNLVMGRSVHEQILTETQKQTEAIKQQTKATQETGKKLDDLLRRFEPKVSRRPGFDTPSFSF